MHSAIWQNFTTSVECINYPPRLTLSEFFLSLFTITVVVFQSNTWHLYLENTLIKFKKVPEIFIRGEKIPVFTSSIVSKHNFF